MQSASIDAIHIGQNDAWKVPGGRWPAIVLAIVLLDVVCFYAFSLFAMDATHFVWMSVNAGVLVFGPVIWREHRRLHRKGAILRERQSERQREGQRQKLEELQRKAREVEHEHLAELRREAGRQRGQVEEKREAERRCQQKREPAAVQSLTEWWRVLEVARSATKEEIVRNYRRKIQQCHPDRMAGLAPEFLELAEERSKGLNAAYAQAMRAQHTTGSGHRTEEWPTREALQPVGQ
jgi:DnaJ-domain-containing protein 1